MITQIISYDGHTFAPDYRVGFLLGEEPQLPPVKAQLLQRIGAWPVIVALQRNPHRRALMIYIESSDHDTLRTQLFQWFDPEDEEPKTLVGRNHAGIDMAVEVLPEELRVFGKQHRGTVFVATVVLSGDVRWRAVTETTDTWNITASGQTRVISNTGEDDAYPVLEITPTTAKSGGYAYKRYCLVTWRAVNPGRTYPVQLGPLDTAALVSGGKVQADGDDLRVFVDGREVPRHLVGMNTASTYVWFSTNYRQAPSLALAASVASTGTVDSIQLSTDSAVNLLPASGFVRVDNEVFSYSALDPVNYRLTGIGRAVWGTAEAAHSAGDPAYWMQHEVVIVYGNASKTAPSVAASEPIFTLASSSNTSWRFDVFGDTTYASRPANWTPYGNLTSSGKGGVYSATERTFSSPFAVAGAWLGELHGNAYGWSLTNPCGIVNAEWSGGKKRTPDVTRFLVHLMYWVRGDSWWDWQATVAKPTTANTWQTWSEPAAASNWAPAETLAVAAYFYAQDVEVGTVIVTLNSSETPVTSIGAELGNYTLAATITNQATGEALRVDFEMAIAQTLQIDTDEKLVLYLADNSPQFQARSLDSVRRHWLRLQPGDNTLRFDDTSTGHVTVTTKFKRRYY